MKIRSAVIALVIGLGLIFSGNGNAYAPVAGNLQQGVSASSQAQAVNLTPQLIIDGITVDLTKLLNSEVPLLYSQDLGVFRGSIAEINLQEKRLHITLKDSVIGLQFLNSALSRTDTSFSLRYSETAQAVLVITAPKIDMVNPFTVEMTTEGEGMKRVCCLLDLESSGGKTSIKNMRRISFPGKTAEYTTLVNGNKPLGATFIPTNLVSIPGTVPAYQSKQNMKLCGEAVAGLAKMLNQAKKEGLGGFTLTSTYRPYAYQSMLFKNKVKQVGSPEEAAKIVARQGTSEHQSGLAIDFSSKGTGLTEYFSQTAQGKWLGKNSWKFGFVLRYPEDKTNITKIVYEPWHFRYIGYPYSKILYDRGLCLEEFDRNIKQYGFYGVRAGEETFLAVYSPGDRKIYLSEATSKNPGF